MSSDAEDADIEKSQLLQRLLLLSAALARTRSRAVIAAAYPKLAEFRSQWRLIDRGLLQPRVAIEIAGLERLTAAVARYHPAEVVIATAHHGHFVAFFSACAHAGLPLAACYRSASGAYLEALRTSGMALVDLDRMRSASHLFETFDTLRAEGRYLIVMLDAPFASRRRYDFLGYRVAASSIPWLYAKRARAAILPLASHVISPRRLGYVCDPALDDVGSDRTQALFDFLGRAVLERCEQYAWTTNAVLLSDPAARETALSFLGEALAWRSAQS